MNCIRRFLRDEHGLETMEYAMIVGLIAAGTIGAMTAIGVWLAARFGLLQTQLGA